MSEPKIDIVILTWNDQECLDVALESALSSAGVDVNVIVVDNGSEPPARVPDDPRVSLIRNDANRGVSGGRNQGARAGNRPFICLLDSDARLHSGGLDALLVPLLADPSVGLSAPTFSGQQPHASAGRAPTLARKLARGLNLRDDYAPVPHGGGRGWWPVDFAIGACQVFRRDAYQAAGGLDETYFYGPEDVDFCLRVKSAGWSVVQLANAMCDHPPRRRFRRLLTRRGAQHALAICRHLWRHRHHDEQLVSSV